MTPGGCAKRVRRMFTTASAKKLVIFSLPAAAALMAVGGAIDPGVDETSHTTYFQGLAQGSAADRYQVSAYVLHLAFFAFIPAMAGLWALARPGWVRTAALVFGTFATATLSGMVVTDYYDIALAKTLSASQAAGIYDEADDLIGAQLLAIPARIGLFVGPLTLLVSAARLRSIPVWTPALFLVSMVLAFAGSAVTFVAAGVVMVIGFGLMAQRMLREPAIA